MVAVSKLQSFTDSLERLVKFMDMYDLCLSILAKTHDS